MPWSTASASSRAVLPTPENMIFSGATTAARARNNSPPETTSAFRRAGLLRAQLDLVTLAEAVGTPFYCYASATLERHYRVFAGAFADGR